MFIGLLRLCAYWYIRAVCLVVYSGIGFGALLGLCDCWFIRALCLVVRGLSGLYVFGSWFIRALCILVYQRLVL